MKDIELPPLPESEYSLCVLDEEGGIQELDNAGYTEDDMKFYARAIESAATAPLLARIAELTRELEKARKDAERYRNIRDNEDARAALAGPCEPDDLDKAVDDSIKRLAGAAIKEQT